MVQTGVIIYITVWIKLVLFCSSVSGWQTDLRHVATTGVFIICTLPPVSGMG